jgi:uncharacterized protein (TIGR00369 family)
MAANEAERRIVSEDKPPENRHDDRDGNRQENRSLLRRAAGETPVRGGGDAPMSPAEPSAELQPLSRIPFLYHLGVLWRDLGEGRSELVLDQQLHHQNSLEMAHGGVIMTMLDVAMARAGSTLADPGRGERPMLITIEMKTTFMSPAIGRIRAEGRVIKRTASLAFCEADLYDGHGHLSARANGTFRYLKERKN